MNTENYWWDKNTWRCCSHGVIAAVYLIFYEARHNGILSSNINHESGQ
jgi:hypothetical protein